jgi:hypothetical protein
MRRSRLFILSGSVIATVLLTACGASELAESATTTTVTAVATTVTAEAPSTTAPSGTTDTTAPEETAAEADIPEPEEANQVCDWESGRLTSATAGDVPTTQGNDIQQVVFGSWQHTHIDDGAGFTPVSQTTDIRYVLSADTFLYCQDVEGATDQAERSAPLTMEGNEIILPSPASGYAVTAWNDDTMVWLNHFDDSLYLLQRR